MCVTSSFRKYMVFFQHTCASAQKYKKMFRYDKVTLLFGWSFCVKFAKYVVRVSVLFPYFLWSGPIVGNGAP